MTESVINFQMEVGAMVGPKRVRQWLEQLATRYDVTCDILETGWINKAFNIRIAGLDAKEYITEVQSTLKKMGYDVICLSP